MDRRYFLSSSVMAAAAFAGPAAEASPLTMLATPDRGPDAVLFSEAGFRSLLGSRFQFTGDEWRGPLQLTEVVARARVPRLEQFTAMFRTDGHAPAPAPGVYQVNHPGAGEFTLRIDGRPESELRQATFALLRG